MRLRYPGVDNLVQLIKSKGRGCTLMKCDLSKAFRQFPIDPGDINLLGFSWRTLFYYNLAVVMGMSTSCYFCQMVTDALRFIYQKRGFNMVNYLDDLAGAELWSLADSAFEEMGKLLDATNLGESVAKRCYPETSLIFLGVLFDSHELTLTITKERLQELRTLLSLWLDKQQATKKEVQMILCKLNCVASCVSQSKIFISRLLNLFRSIPVLGKVNIPTSVKTDLLWWYRFLPIYSGVSMMAMEEWSRPDEVFSTDACLVGCGGWSAD